MNLIGILHIVLTLIGYVIYVYITMKSVSNEVSYRLLTAANILYAVGFGFGLIWAKIEWGFYLNLDIKNILSILLFIPFVVENIIQTRKPYLLSLGTILILLNYVLPKLLNTIHIH
ncbi:hypothetical protein AKJ50_02365 [candidate division MSBL1 archaeon SCGC-AAA382A13]|uniref:Uncharacterized protein n=1 Tax=candidate division MSBL1 archaeon SCGC-AAA382A13 TaxID=1698279 RepID=A0A133VDH6_9EURY|nr:hypothetical protein AKJ50_02365 [candidate division MSBL1 archaeon SCGC-AAA382A13]